MIRGTRTARDLAARLAVMALLVSASCASGDDGASSTTPPSAATESPSPTATASGVDPFSGRGECEDPVGDVQFPNPGADLVSVALDTDADSFGITWLAAGPIEPSEGVEWRVETWVGVRLAQYFIVTGDGANWSAKVIEQGNPQAQGTGEATVRGNSLHARFPFESILDGQPPTFGSPFTWAALTSGAQIDGDHCPDRRSSLAGTDERLPFPRP